MIFFLCGYQFELQLSLIWATDNALYTASCGIPVYSSRLLGHTRGHYKYINRYNYIFFLWDTSLQLALAISSP